MHYGLFLCAPGFAWGFCGESDGCSRCHRCGCFGSILRCSLLILRDFSRYFQAIQAPGVLAALLTTFALIMPCSQGPERVFSELLVGVSRTRRFQATSYLNPIDWLNGGGKVRPSWKAERPGPAWESSFEPCGQDRHPMTFPMVAFGFSLTANNLGRCPNKWAVLRFIHLGM